MPRLTTTLAVVAALFAGGFAVAVLKPQPEVLNADQVRDIASAMIAADRAATPPIVIPERPDEGRVRDIVGEMIAEAKANTPPPEQSVAQIDSTILDPMIESYLLNNPTILDRVDQRLASIKRVAARETEKQLLQTHQAAIYDDPNNVVIGNPDGDVTLVEFFDYNCGYCRSSLPDLVALVAEDPNLRVILKEFPILTAGSEEAAKVATLVAGDPPINYWDFHQQLFSTRGPVAVESALDVAEGLGANRIRLMIDMNATGVSDALQRTADLAGELRVSGTPTFILGDKIVPGAVGIDLLRAGIANIRACGSVDCQSPPG